MPSKLICQNIEGKEEFNIEPTSWVGRKSGLSAMIRLGNEQEWIRSCIESIYNLFDEIVCTLQCSTDNTYKILQQFEGEKLKIYHYPFKSYPNGQGHDKQAKGSVYERAYFYNWSLALTTYKWVSKWDGDMVAHDWLDTKVKAIIEQNKYDVICMAGTNIVHGLEYKSKIKPSTANEPRFFNVFPGVYYFSGKMCEDICHPSFKRGEGFGNGKNMVMGTKSYKITKHGYLHFKHAKQIESATMAWPEDWQKSEHFKRINKYEEPGDLYTGDIPRTLREKMHA